MSGRPASRGFTLIEIMVAFLILGVMLSSAYQVVQTASLRQQTETGRLELIRYANLVWHALALERKRDSGGLSMDLPENLSITIGSKPIEGMEFGGWQAKGNVDWVSLTVAIDDQSLTLEGAMPAGQ